VTMKDLAYRLDELQRDAEKIESFQMALWQAIYRGDFDVKTYELAFVAFGDLTFALANNLQTLVDEAFDILRAGKDR